MKTIVRACVFFLALVVSSACVREEYVEFAAVELSARMEYEADTKTTLSGLENGMYYPLWSAGDEIAVFVDGSSTPSKFKLQSGEGYTVASFAGTRKGEEYAAIYPYDMAESLSDGTITLTLPQTQEYAPDSFGQGSFPMIATGGSDGSLKFMNLCSVLKISLTGQAMIRSITVTANDKDTYLSGPATVYSEYDDVPELVMSDGCFNSVKLGCNGCTLSGMADFYIVIPSQTYEGGLTVEIDTYMNKVTKLIESDLVFERSQIRTIKGLTLDSDISEQIQIPDNEIWYVSDTGDVLELDSYTTFGADVVSNTYEDGMGRICFNRNITGIYSRTSVADDTHDNELAGHIFAEPSRLHAIGLPKTTEKIYGPIFSLSENLTCFWGDLSSEDNRCIIINKELVSFAQGGIDEYTTPPEVKVIGSYSFSNTKALKKIIISAGVYSISERAFDKSDVEEVFIPSTLTSYNLDAFRCSEIKRFHGSARFVSEDGLSFIFASILGKYASGSGLTEYSIPEGVKKIGNYAFYGADELRKLNFPDSFESINSYSFEGTKNVEMISGSNVLSDNRSLVKDNKLMFVATGGLEKYTTPSEINELSSGVFNFKGLRELVISDNVVFTDYCEMFRGSTELESLTISARLASLGDNPFVSYSWMTPNLRLVFCRALVPPAIDYYGFSEDAYKFEDLTIFVPEESLDLYMESDYWEPYRDYIQPYKFDYEDINGTTPDFYMSSDFSADGTVEVLQTATEGKGINVVLLGDGYSDRQIAKGMYRADMKNAYNSLFTVEPTKSFKNMFNVSYVNVVSLTEGYDYMGKTALECMFGNNIGLTVSASKYKCLSYAKKVVKETDLDETVIIVVMNHDSYVRACCHLYNSKIKTDYGSGLSISYCTRLRPESTFVHEAIGHGLAKLGDEYVEYNSTIPESMVEDYKGESLYGWWKNIDFTSDPSQVKWAKFLDDERYDGEGLGVFEGAKYQFGAYRPSESSLMGPGNLGGFNAPSREAIYYRIHKLAYGADWEYDYEKFVEYDSVNRAAASAAGPQKHRANYVEEIYERHTPPVVVGKTWREAAGENVPMDY